MTKTIDLNASKLGVARSSRAGALVFMESSTPQAKIIHLLLARLERISADSYWAHRASGVRGALIRIMESEAPENPSIQTLESLSRLGFQILERAAREKR